jgi:hypothetical protein
MASRRRPRFESNLRRAAPGRLRARERLLIVCGSHVTESDYLRGLVRHVANPAVTVRIKNR